MAKRRMIDPSIWDDPDVGELSGDAFKLFIGLISNADDDGRVEADPRKLKKIVFGYRDDLSSASVAAIRAELLGRLSSVVLYAVGDREYIALLRWCNYQTIAREKHVPSKLPPPSDGILEDAPRHPIGIPSAAEGQSDSTLSKGKVIKENLSEGNQIEDGDAPALAQVTKLAAVPKPKGEASKSTTGKTAAPKGLEITPRMEVWAAEKVPRVVDLDDATEEWLDYCRRENVRFSDWEAAWRNAMRRAQDFADKKGRSTNGQRQNGNKPKRAIDESVDYFTGIYAEQDEAPERGNRLGLHGPAHGPTQRPGA